MKSIATLLLIGAGCLAVRPAAAAEEGATSLTNVPYRLVTSGWKASWSPDARKIVYGQPDGKGLDIYDLTAKTNRVLTDAGKDAIWSPDGQWIAYVREPEVNAYTEETTWIIAPEGGKPRMIYPGGFPGWSADSRLIYAHSRRENKLVACDITKTNGEPVTVSDKPLSWYPAVSPDGKMIAYPMANQTLVLDQKTGETRFKIPMEGERGGLAGWSPDSQWILIGGYDNSPMGVWLVDLKAGKVVQVAEGPFTMPSWSPKGDKLALDLRRGRTREVWVFPRDWVEARMAGKVPFFPAPRVTTPR